MRQLTIIGLLCLMLHTGGVSAQVTRADYQRGEEQARAAEPV